MGYPRDLDDYTDQELSDEQHRRQKARHHGLCDYCGRKPDTPPCRYRARHTGDKKLEDDDNGN